MISYINGVLAETDTDAAVVDVNGVGYEVYASQTTLDRMPSVGSPVKLYTYMSVREDAMTLFGFLSKDELQFFKMLIGVSGIGPKGALSILSVMSPDDLRFAILSADAKAISRAPGIGKKTAERMVLELHDKISPEDITHGVTDGVVSVGTLDALSSESAGAEQEAVAALVALGYSSTDAIRAVRKVLGAAGEDAKELTTEDVLRLALKEII